MKQHRTLRVAAAALALFAVTGCYTMQHTVGTGPTTGETSHERVWYALWGLIPLHEVDGGKLAHGAGNYSIETSFTPLDIVIGIFTGLVSIQPQTVTVMR